MESITPYTPHVPGAPGRGQKSSEFHEFLGIWSALVRQRKIWSAVFFGFAGAVLLITLLMPKTYTATAQLMAGNPSTQSSAPDQNTALPVLNALVLQSGELSAETFATLAQQQDVAATVVRDLNLTISSKSLLSRLTVKPVVNTPILNLSIAWSDPATAAKIANAFGDAFIRRERDFVRSQATSALNFLSAEIPAAQDRMNAAETNLANFQASKGFVNASTHTQDVVSQATSLDGKIEAASLDKREAQALLANVAGQMRSLPATVNNAQQLSVNPVLSDLRTKLESVDIQLAQARQQYTEEHPAVIALQKQHDSLVAAIALQPAQINSANTLSPNPIYQSLEQQATQYKERVDGDNAQLALLQSERSRMAPILSRLPQQSVQLASLQQQAKLASDVYNALEQKYNDATIARTTAISDISFVQPATPESAVKRPSLRANMLVAIVVGLLLASIVAYVIDMLQQPVRLSRSESRFLDLPIIGRIPAFNEANQKMLPWIQSMTIESFMHLCVSLRLKTLHPLRTLAITSACRGDGKSTVAFNLAKAMATMQSRVLLIDADMRCPVLHQRAGCENDTGLRDVLTSTVPLAQAIVPLSNNLDLLTAGSNPPNPIALLQSDEFAGLLKHAEKEYELVIVDSPALASVSDGLLVSSRVDGTVLVVAADSTDESEAKRIVGQFSQLGINNVLGIVINKDTKRVRDYSDYFAQSGRPESLMGSA